MSIDPRVMKALLQLQLSPGFGSEGSVTSNNNSGDLFQSLLKSLMNETSAAQSSNMDRSAMSSLVESALLYNNISTGMPSISTGLTADAVTAGGSNATFTKAMSAYEAGSLDGSSTTAAGGGQQSSGPNTYDSLIDEASRKYGVDFSLVKSVISTESDFNPSCVSSAGAKGLMQLMDENSRELGVTDPFDPVQNIDGGTRDLSNLIRKYDGSVPMALAAYNAGSGRLARLGITNETELNEKYTSLPKETQRYIIKVMDRQQQYTTI